MQINLFVCGYDMSSVASQISVNGNTGNFALTSVFHSCYNTVNVITLGGVGVEGNGESNAIEKERKRERKKEYDAENPCIRVKIRKDSGVVDALNKACCALRVAKNEYVRRAVCERMEEDRDARYAKETNIR